ncbi:hypothetical protein ACIFOT_08785 [Neobacillus sp. NRS-1170]|uniref:hypothetical protein n=1 Tax=Neobacillus sp. NRS-1170 TaxID=3233898 RepID=UPI003D2A5775
MKRIIALSSFLFLLLMTVLPAGVSHAASNPAVKLTGITFVLANGEKINAVGDKNNNFTLNLVGGHDLGDKIVKEIDITSDTAVTLSTLPSGFDYSEVSPLTKDEFDIQFVNGVAVLDPQKAANWSSRIDKLIDGTVDPVEETPDQLFTVDELKTDIFPMLSDLYANLLGINVESKTQYLFPGHLTDKDGNESPASLKVITKGWKQDAKGWKVYDEFGDYLTGWYVENGKWYYLNPKNAGYMVTGWFQVNGKWYFFTPSGVMATGLVKSNGKPYILGQSGAMLTGTGWVKDGSGWYYLVKDIAKTGWVKDKNKWYYLNPATGKMATGWVKVGPQWYYLDGSGVMKTGWVKVSNKWYFLYNDGHMAANTRIGKDWVGKDGAWVPGK